MTKNLLVAGLILANLLFPVFADAQAGPSVPLFRLYHPQIVDHFYTTNSSERDAAISRFGYQNEGVAAQMHPMAVANAVPLFRLYQPRTTDHFYTTSAIERDQAVQRFGYRSEGTSGFIQPNRATGVVPLYRLFHPRFVDHFYTTTLAEQDAAVQRFGYRFEGITGFVLPKQTLRTVQSFFYNEERDRQLSGGDNLLCSPDAVLPVERQIEVTQTPIQDALRLLLTGEVTAEERAQGFRTEFPNAQFHLRGANLRDGVLTLEFSEVPEFTTGGACRVGLLTAQLQKTALQFPEVREVQLRPATLFQP